MAEIVGNQSKPSPGGTITYSVWVWSTVQASQVRASVAADAKQMQAPQFTLCPGAHTASCRLGSLPANQAFEMVITDQVRTKAAVGHQVTLTVTVTGAGLSPAEAAVTTVLTQKSQSPPPSSGTVPPETFPPYTFPGTTVTPGGLSGLFPTVTPSASPAGSPASRGRRPSRRFADVSSSALPLDPRIIGGQLAGLAVLAAAITMVVARLSLRTPQAAASAAPSSGAETKTSPASAATKADAAPAPAKDKPDEHKQGG